MSKINFADQSAGLNPRNLIGREEIFFDGIFFSSLKFLGGERKERNCPCSEQGGMSVFAIITSLSFSLYLVIKCRSCNDVLWDYLVQLCGVYNYSCTAISPFLDFCLLQIIHILFLIIDLVFFYLIFYFVSKWFNRISQVCAVKHYSSN